MPSKGLDYSHGRPSGSSVKAAGYDFVIRYVSEPGGIDKDITRAEYRDMLNNNVAVGIVYQNGKGDALEGRSGGRTRAANARRYANAVGFPGNRPIYMAVDMDITTQLPTVIEYLRGACDVLGGPQLVGVYGEYDVVEAAAAHNVANWYWQTKAWSKGKISARAHIIQEIGQVRVDGVTCDVNTAQKHDIGTTGGSANQREDDDMAVHVVVKPGEHSAISFEHFKGNKVINLFVDSYEEQGQLLRAAVCIQQPGGPIEWREIYSNAPGHVEYIPKGRSSLPLPRDASGVSLHAPETNKYPIAVVVYEER